MAEMKNSGEFATKIGFVMASVGSAVGMGNIWMFPYRVGQYGGAAFLIPYFLFVALFGWVGLSGEFGLGRLTGTGPIGSYDYAMKSRGKRGGKFLGAIPLFGSLGIAIGYSIVVGWVLRSMFGSLTGAMLDSDAGEFFAQMTGPFGSVPWHLAVIVITVLVLACGAVEGIEKVNKVMMPSFFILFLIIAVRVAFLPGAAEGYAYLLIPHWEQLLRPETWIMAMGQAFFSLSITGSGMIIYGSYLSKKEDIVHSSGLTAALDTVAALIAGFAIIPAVFAFGLDPQKGPPLLFITLPKVFAQMPAGRLFAVLFFLSVLFAGITSLVNMFEVVGEAVQRHLRLARVPAMLLVGAVAFAVGVFIEYEPYMGRWMDMITIYVVPAGAVLGAVMIYWVLGLPKIRAELMRGRSKPLGKAFDFCAKYLYVLLAAAVVAFSVIYQGIG
ncbi:MULTISPECIES: sodium-dependent transporter [Anaerotruncus]|uniref:sodium-dependent transporter n=1 Tax=Anaerotruncus TaxID=244127 RepID=UPI0008361F3B|nr:MULTISPECIES: sodium-dependent transporter [Anaerotruncus]RGX54515.1 sodium-dependent transporter [Anaerotruncus sp. AF02-27]